jgi:anti-anti-sigma factor
MSIEQVSYADQNQIEIKIKGHFDFSLHQKFRDAYINSTEQQQTYIINLSETQYMDSSALGMILLLKDHTEKYNGSIVLKQPNELISKILEIAQFHRLFSIID